MPTYDYECVRCGATKEVVHSIWTEPKVVCDFGADCGGKMKRILSRGTTFQLKGPGWAKDGYS